jgi:hypothetical protein
MRAKSQFARELMSLLPGRAVPGARTGEQVQRCVEDLVLVKEFSGNRNGAVAP